MDDRVYLLGIRHHGPGSAISACTALEQLQPDMILIEGPQEAEPVLELAGDPDMEPPVALMLYARDDLSQCAFYPFADYSPEWQAIRHGLRREIPIRFCDLPQTHMLAFQGKRAQTLGRSSDTIAPEDKIETDGTSEDFTPPPDPLGLLARAAGFSDGERWWEYMVEHRREGLEVFEAIGEAMGAVREAIEENQPIGSREALREAWMRKTLRQALRDCEGRIAVICGAWHVPALQRRVKRKDDNALLKGLPKTKVVATWVPWTYQRLASQSGYGAGVDAPGWYEHLWQTRTAGADRSERIAMLWLAKAAAKLRHQGLDVSSANVIEAVRLGQTLAALRTLPLPGLDELEEAILTTFCFGDEMPLRLLRDNLIIGTRLGRVSERVPLAPLQQDLAREQKRLRLKPEADSKVVELDLRNDTGVGRSELLHRLTLLDIPWGRVQESSGGKGTFREIWQLCWEPEFAIRLVEAGVHGGTIRQASTTKALELLRGAEQLATITALIDALLLANLPEAVQAAVCRLESEVAVADDIQALMSALPPLVRIRRYGNVRGTDTTTLTGVIDGIVPRVCVGLSQACQSLDEEAGRAMMALLEETSQALRLLDEAGYLESWWRAVTTLSSLAGVNGLVGGKCYRLLLDAGMMAADDAAEQLHFVLSRGADPAEQAAWVEGLLDGSGLLLVHDDKLWSLVDGWLCGLEQDHFIGLLPLLRRAFANFETGERRHLLDRALAGRITSAQRIGFGTENFDLEWAEAGLPLIKRLLGLEHISADSATSTRESREA